MNLRDKAKEMTILLPFMDGRVKGDIEDIIGKNVTINDYGFLVDNEDGKSKEYVCFIIEEDPNCFYFGGMVLTDHLKELQSDGYYDSICSEGLPVKLDKKKSKNKREYTTVEFYPMG